MKIATLYDIHGNLPALEAVLTELERAAPDALVIGGDVVAGPLPVETLELLQSLSLPTYFLLGNAEADILSCWQTGVSHGLSAKADEEAKWLVKKLPNKQLEFLSTWSDTVKLELRGLGNVLFCHATALSNTLVFTQNTSEEKVRGFFASAEAKTIICGHTHMQFERSVGEKRIYNSGSVGMPFGEKGAHWLILDERVHFKCTEYNYAKAAQLIQQSDYPDAEGFTSGNVLSTPTQEEALAFLERLELSQENVSNSRV
jgi:predicted phosphodiesterase